MRATRQTALACVAVACAACAGDAAVREPVAAMPSASSTAALPPQPSAAPVPNETPSAPTPTCPSLAEWDVSRCAPKKVDCAAGTTWNGGWCLDVAVERAAALTFARVDADIHLHFGPDGAAYEYAGTILDVIGSADASGQVHPGQYQRDSTSAEHYDAELRTVSKTYSSPNWRAAAIARQGTLFDELWAALQNAEPPRITLFTPAQDALLNRLSQPPAGTRAGIAASQSQFTNDLRATVTKAWKRKKDALLAESSKTAVSLYATAVALAELYGITNPQVTHAEGRLAAFTIVLGDETMHDYVTHTHDPNDVSGRTMLAYRAGMYRSRKTP